LKGEVKEVVIDSDYLTGRLPACSTCLA